MKRSLVQEAPSQRDYPPPTPSIHQAPCKETPLTKTLIVETEALQGNPPENKTLLYRAKSWLQNPKLQDQSYKRSNDSKNWGNVNLLGKSVRCFPS
eukprot:5285876-Amphidinium_carterae.1